jgi:hypothetical protein
MRKLALMVVLLLAISSRAETLRDVLKTGGIPEDKFTKAELDQEVNGWARHADQVVVAVYVRLKGEMLTGNPQVVRYERNRGVIQRAEVKPEDEDFCCGSPGDIEFAGDFIILSFHIKPSAEAMLVLGKDVKQVTTLYGFNVREVLPGQIVLIENMIHFAPVHPERLELADLHTGARTELYPSQGDALRAAFASEHKKRMPPRLTCEKMNDPCTPELYDEDIEFAGEDGHGNFAFTVHRDAVHATAEEQPPNSIASEAALYRYSWNGNAWLYCEEKLSDREVQSLTPAPGKIGETSTRLGCTPNLPVTPDMSNADYSPFSSHRSR